MTYIQRLSILIIIALLIIISCNNDKQKGLRSPTESSSISNDTSYLVGAWGNNENENANFGFYTDSIYYPDPNLWCKYFVYQDTLNIIQEDGYIEKIYIKYYNGDSLILYYPRVDIMTVYKRRK
jgi:hypothetical protein